MSLRNDPLPNVTLCANYRLETLHNYEEVDFTRGYLLLVPLSAIGLPPPVFQAPKQP
jgi:hypothetical protein